MPSLIDFRRRIRTVKNMQQITKAMKMVSAAKLRRAQDRVIAARPYGAILHQMLKDIAASDLAAWPAAMLFSSGMPRGLSARPCCSDAVTTSTT